MRAYHLPPWLLVTRGMPNAFTRMCSESLFFLPPMPSNLTCPNAFMPLMPSKLKASSQLDNLLFPNVGSGAYLRGTLQCPCSCLNWTSSSNRLFQFCGLDCDCFLFRIPLFPFIPLKGQLLVFVKSSMGPAYL
jgi:hypothetical protein